MVARVFDHNVLHSYDRLQHFFQDTDAVEQVLNRRDRVALPEPEYAVKVAPSLNPHFLPHLHGGWNVCQLVTAPFRWILGIVLRAIAYVLKWLGAEECSKDVKRAARICEAGFALPWSFSDRCQPLLQRTENHVNDQGIVSQTPPILREQIEDPKVRNRVRVDEQDQVTFTSERGICRGMCEWFIYLYFKTKDQFADPRNHMMALAEQFAEGGGIEPTLLQRLNIKNGKLLDMRFGLQEERAHGESGKSALSRTFFDWKDAQEERVQELNNLPVGVYYVSITFHAMAYIKVDNDLGFLFDPNGGVFEVKGEEKGDLLYFYLLNQMGPIVKKTIKTGTFWNIFSDHFTPEELEALRNKPRQEALEMATDQQVPRLAILFYPCQMREPVII